jgi:hypothetical protein
MHVFTKHNGKIFHFWGTETVMNHLDYGLAVLEPDGLHPRADRTVTRRRKNSGPSS